MNDTEKERETAPACEAIAANNNVENPTEAPGATEAAEPSAEERVAALEAEIAEQKDHLLRALAETENVRRRAQREREDALKYAVAGFAKELLSVADNLRRALDSLPETEAREERTRGLLAGVAATERELLSVFERHGIRRIDPDGERFDHNLHQAIFEAERPGKPDGMIIEVLQPGYVLHDRLLRPAMVGVAKGNQGSGEPTESATTVA
ncbi:MAG: nucleotide exchange factor GrpE [Alphaproteobacteria bacterium]|nr:nucleotide exchange factor GrpE [Alphaproteobacteria bacterium]